MTKTYLNEIPYTFGEIIKVVISDTGETYAGIRNEFNSVEAIAYVRNEEVYYLPVVELKGKTLSKTLGDEDEKLALHVTQKEVEDYNVDLGQEFKDRIEQILSEWPNHSFYIA